MQFDHFWHGLLPNMACHVTQESNKIYIFGKHMTRAIQKYKFYLFWTSISKVMAI